MTDTIEIQGKTYIVMTEGELDQLLRDAKDEGAIIMRDALWRAQVEQAPRRYPEKKTIPSIDRR